eukprot:TRINITY_DN7118_c0_g2_i1.p1 TRINITY_DN7118_c0_g2~~TRINITY_DN7118_c0_g2_i1.p1  ORF type:complete len:424 (-),score=82.61 TRINITY_DN7118_c0_g2_i1:139-1410(-)
MEGKKESSDLHFVPPFEGPEKLLELWFDPGTRWKKQIKRAAKMGNSKPAVYGLRTIPRSTWEEVLGIVKCKIINVISNDYLDSYLLSESSMFVWNTKIIVKTCGTTTTLYAIPRILEEAKNVGLFYVDNVFYSRKKFLYPQLQQPIHSKFESEVEYLDGIFDDGASYSLGTTKEDKDNWNLYTIEHKTVSDSESDSASEQEDNSEVKQDTFGAHRDQTLEILMHDLDPEAMIPFWKNSAAGFDTADDSTVKSGIAGFFPDAVLDAYLFDPCGYSINGLIPQNPNNKLSKGEYFTIHITPQKSCSYVSFETNVERETYNDLIRDVVNVFKPGRYIVSFFSNENLTEIQQRIQWSKSVDASYSQGARTYYNFEEYSLMFVQATKKKPKEPGGESKPRVSRRDHAKHVALRTSAADNAPPRDRTPG